MSIDDLNKDVSEVMALKPLENVRHQETMGAIESAARKEVSSAQSGLVIFTDNDNLTPGMLSFIESPLNELSKWVSKTNQLLLKIKHSTDNSDDSKHQDSLREISMQAEREEAAVRDKFYRENNYTQAKQSFERCQARYDKMNKAHDGRPPVKANVFFYILVLLLVGFVEFFVNFETLNAKYAAPALATGGTALIAIAFAMASHFMGGFVKQRLDLLGPDVEKRKKRNAIYVFCGAASLGVIALAAITLIRYQVIIDELSILTSGGPLDLEPVQSATELLIPFILMNVAVWFVGIFLAYIVHDSSPSYQEAEKDLRIARKHFNKLDASLKEEVDRVKATFDKRTQEITNTTRADRSEYNRAVQLGEQLVVHRESLLQDALKTINADIKHYQNILLTIAKTEGIDLKFGFDNDDLAAYKRRDITLDLNQFREKVGA